jgi:hypothetical protein
MPEFTLQLICCGRDDGRQTFGTWEDAQDFRESYTTRGAVCEKGYGCGQLKCGNGHHRAAIIQRASEILPRVSGEGSNQ